MGRVFELPLNAGLDEGGDRAMLEMGKLRILNNARIARDNRIEVRPAYVAQQMTAWGGGGNLVPQDLAIYEDRLLALGNQNSVTFPREIFTHINVTQADWKGLTDAGVASFPILPVVTELEILWNAPAGVTMTSSDVAYTNGYVCAVQTDPVTQVGKVYVLRGSSALPVQTLSISSVRSLRVVSSGNIFILLIRTVAGDIEARTFDTTSSTVFSASTTLEAGVATGTVPWDASAKTGSTDLLVCYPVPGTPATRVRRYNQALVQQATVTIAGTPGNMCIIGNASFVLLATRENTTAVDVNLYTLNQSTLATTSGPTVVLGPTAVPTTGNCFGTPALAFLDSTTCLVECSGNSSVSISSMSTQRAIVDHGSAATFVADDVSITSKLYTQPLTSTFDTALGVGVLVVDGHKFGVDQVFATCIQGTGQNIPYVCEARWNYGVADRMIDHRAINYHGRSSIVTDGTGTFWACCGTLNDGLIRGPGGGTLQVVRFKSGSSARRQTAESQGALYLSGGFVGYYDGSTLSESGFLDTPKILSATEGATGALTALGTYNYVVIYEWYDAKGRLHRSNPCVPFPITLTGANDDVTLIVSTARSLRRVDWSGGAGTVTVVFYRTVNDDSVLFRVGSTLASSVPADYANTVSFLDTMSDATAQEQAVLYTQSQKPTPNVAPQACQFVAAGRDRLIFGGLPDPYMIAFSQLPFPNEPLESVSPNNFAYLARLPEPCTAVAAPGDSYIAFSEQAIYEIPGSGPQRNGAGEFFTPRTLYSDGGCIDWRSVCDTAAGVFFQLASDKLYLLSSQGELIWIGKPVQDTLTTYPVIRASALCTNTQRVAFAVVDSDSAPTAGGVLVYDIQKQAWSFDDVGIVKSLVEYQSRLAYLHNDNIVYLEQATVGSGGTALPTVSIRTGSIRLFQALGYGDIIKIGLLGTYLGDCTVEGFISYDDGKTWLDNAALSMGQQAVTAANMFNPVTGAALAVGDPVSIVFTPNRRTVDRFALRFDITNGTNTGGMRCHAISLEAESQEFTTRQPARNQK